MYLEMQTMNVQFVLEYRIGGWDVRLEFSTVRVIRKESLACLLRGECAVPRLGLWSLGPLCRSFHSCPVFVFPLFSYWT